MTDASYSETTNNAVDFKPRSQLAAEAQLSAFIEWAKQTLPKGIPNRVHSSIRWEDCSWHSHGCKGCSFNAFGSTISAPKAMQAPYTEFAKAIVVYRWVYMKKTAEDWLKALKALEVALFELTGTRDVTRVSAAVCNKACEHMNRHWTKSNTAYCSSKSLEAIITLMRAKKLLKSDFRWTSPLLQMQRGTLKQQKADREQKLPNPDAINVLGQVFSNELISPLDIVVTSACALLLSVPSRVGELADVELNCLEFKKGTQGNRRMFLRWYAEKINQVTLKPVVKPEMEPVVERAITLLKSITDEARAYAAWLEDHPDEFPPHEGLPPKGPDEPLTYAEACATLKLTFHKDCLARRTFNLYLKQLEKKKVLSPAARALLAEILDSRPRSGKKLFVEGKPGAQGAELDEQHVITLRKLNMLMREKYLPKDFPYTTPYKEGKARVKYRDALFTVRTGALAENSAHVLKCGFGVEIATNTGRMNVQLGGTNNRKQKSLFERYGYPGVKVNTHAFRHELNTRMHQAGLSQLLIDAFSGRTTMGSVYNHETIEERTQGVAAYHPKTKHSTAVQRLDKINTNQPLTLGDVRELREGELDRIIHQTHLGVCVHNFAYEPCPKMGACLDCGLLGCVKGDEMKLGNLKEERHDLKRRLDKAQGAQSRGVFGASESAKKLGEKLYKCEALIQTLENPELENGAIVWNADNGWTLTKNAAAMSGGLEVKVIEENKTQETLTSLDDVKAFLDEIEG